MKRFARGMVLGKFMPPHRGHQYLIEFARACSHQLTVVVGTLANEPIPGELRYRWMKELYPDVEVVHLTDENPQQPHEHPDFWEIWRKSLERVLPVRPDAVFASEDYGAKLAELFGARFVPVDRSRTVFPISGTRVRSDPLAAWEYLPECVRPHFVRRVCVFGPESTGKTTLAKRLAEKYATVWVPEYARELLETKQGAIDPQDFDLIALGQIASEDVLARRANRMLVLDTDVLATTLWSRALTGACSAWIDEAADARAAHLYLVTGVDVPWVADSVRYLPNDRQPFLDRCIRALETRGRRYVLLSGGWEERLARACEAIDALTP